MSRIPVLLCVAIVAACEQRAPTDQDSLAGRAKRAVAEQATAEMLTWRRSDAGFSPDQVTLDPRAELVDEGQVWRARIPIDHFHPYLILAVDTALVPVGGFQNPDAIRAARVLGLAPTDASTARTAARRLALLLDPNGGQVFVFAGDSIREESPLLRARDREESLPFPADTILPRGHNGWLVRVNTISRTTSYEASWSPRVYLFAFNRNGELSNWSVREGRPFSTEARSEAISPGK
jgi:hypothetical protein